MAKFQYQILVGRDVPNAPGLVNWSLNDGRPVGQNLPAILNELGAEGWEVTGLGDVGFSARTEIILKKEI